MCLWKKNVIWHDCGNYCFVSHGKRSYLQSLFHPQWCTSYLPFQESHHHHLLPCPKFPTKARLKQNYNLRISQPKHVSVTAVVSDKRDKIFCSVFCAAKPKPNVSGSSKSIAKMLRVICFPASAYQSQVVCHFIIHRVVGWFIGHSFQIFPDDFLNILWNIKQLKEKITYYFFIYYRMGICVNFPTKWKVEEDVTASIIL